MYKALVMLSGCLNVSFTISQNSIYGHIKTPSLGFLIASCKLIIQNILGGLLDVQQSVASSRCVLLVKFAGMLYSAI